MLIVFLKNFLNIFPTAFFFLPTGYDFCIHVSDPVNQLIMFTMDLSLDSSLLIGKNCHGFFKESLTLFTIAPPAPHLPLSRPIRCKIKTTIWFYSKFSLALKVNFLSSDWLL